MLDLLKYLPLSDLASVVRDSPSTDTSDPAYIVDIELKISQAICV